MATDPNIIFQLGRGVTPLLSPAEVQNQQLERESGMFKMNALRQSAQDDAAYRSVLQSGTSPDQIPNRLFQAGLGKQGQEFQKFNTDQQKTQADTRKAKLEAGIKQFEAIGQIMSGVRDQPTYDLARQQVATIVGPEAMANIPAVYDAATVQRNQQQAMSVKDRMAQELQGRGQEITMRGQDMLQDTSLRNNAATVGVSRDRLAYDQAQPKGQVVQTENGPMMVDPRTAEARPIMAGGTAVQKPGKDIPANVNKSIIENRQSISNIDKAIAEIDAKPGALGPINMIPGAETVRQFTDPEGVIARAGVADIGSLILHDRSGAAVTASETPRLRPFIPSASDRPEEAKKKLQRFKEIYEEEAGLLAQTYGKDQGYKEPPLLRGATSAPKQAPAGGAARPADKAAFDALPSGTLFVAPDGTTRRKP